MNIKEIKSNYEGKFYKLIKKYSNLKLLLMHVFLEILI